MVVGFLPIIIPHQPRCFVLCCWLHCGNIRGIIGDLWHGIVEKSINFTTTISLPPDGKWGSVVDDGNWNGMVGGLLDNRSDVD